MFRRLIAFIMLGVALSAGLSSMLTQDVQAVEGTYYLECDTDGLNGIYRDSEYIIFFKASSFTSSTWNAMDHAVLRIKTKEGILYNSVSINGGQSHQCHGNNANLAQFDNIDRAVEFIKWAEKDQYTRDVQWVTDSKNGDSSTLYWAYLNKQVESEYTPGKIPSSVDDWDKIGMVTCRWAADDDVLGYNHLIEYYDRSGELVTTERSADTYSRCSDWFKNKAQASTSPAKNWARKESEGLTYIINPNGYADAWGMRTDIAVDKTECELSANPQLDGAVTSCRVSVSGDTLANGYIYSSSMSGANVVRVNATTFDIVASADVVKEVGDSFVIMLWRAGSKQPTMGEQWYDVGKDLVKVTVNRVANTGAGGEVTSDWKAEAKFYDDCDGWDFRSSTASDYCVVLSGNGLKRSDGSLHNVFVTVTESNDVKHPVGSQNFTVKKASERYWFEVSDYNTSLIKVKFCLDNNDGTASNDCRTLTIGESHEVLPDTDTGECPDGYTLQEDGTCKNDVVVGAGEDPEEPKVDCFTGGGALGWILCPVLEGAAEAVNWAYDSIIEPFLNIDARLFVNDPSVENSGSVFNAWSIFQGFANIVFIILLLVVIFSQLTGVGIDNYGVKKILPKLIMSAILINLSYIICQLAVDLSNVLGYAIRALFDNIASGVTISGGTFAVSGTATFLTALVSVMALGAGVALIATNGLALLLPLIIGIIGALIAVFFLFVLLGVRQAGVVLMVVISPLAFVCYMLPNTKKLFDRWQKMFMGLLMFFPICGLLIGAGGLASKILLSTNSDSFFMALIAMLLNVVPFFFLPMLLKASFAAMGNIGAKISGFGQNINKRAQGAGRSALDRSRFGQWAQRGKNYREYQRGEASKVRQSQFQRGKAQGVIDRYGGRNMADLSAQERARLSSARQTISAHDSQQTKMFADSFSNMGTGGEVANGLRQALDSGDDNMAAAAIDDLAARGDFDVLSSTLAQYDPSKFTPAMRDRLSNSLITHKKDAAHLWGWSKQMKSGNTMSLEEYASGRVAQRGADGRIVRDSAGRAQFTSNALQDASGNSISMRKDLEKENDDLMSTQDKTSLEAINSLTGGNGSAAFSDKQMINAAGNLDKASSQKQFNEMLLGSGRTQEIMHQMSAAQIAKIKGSTLEAIAKQSGYVPVLNAQTGKEDYSGFDLSGHVSADALKQLSDPQNASILAGMNEDVRKSLGIPATSPTPPPTPPPPPPSP